MIKIKVTYASVLMREPEEVELTSGTLGELKEIAAQKLGSVAVCFASGGNLLTDPGLKLAENQEVFIFPMVAGG